jgi:hypothetical protein
MVYTYYITEAMTCILLKHIQKNIMELELSSVAKERLSHRVNCKGTAEIK